MKKLMRDSASQFLIALLGLGSLLFITAGSFGYANGWLFLAALFIPDLLLIIYLYKTDPELLQKRLDRAEKEKVQKLFNVLYYLVALTILIIPALNFRYGWTELPLSVVIFATVIMVSGFALSVVAMHQNRFASRTVERQSGQKVIDSGLYSVIRHPMYLSALFFFCPMPLVLGSIGAFIVALVAIPLLLVLRISNEEKVLSRELEGYEEYRRRVRYRLIPYLW